MAEDIAVHAQASARQGIRFVSNGKEYFLDDQTQQRDQMAAMGFSREAVETALAFNGGNVEASVAWLMSPSSREWLDIVGAGGVSLQGA